MHSQWPVSGRSTELDHLTTLLAGGGTGVLVVGEEGVGKSRVLSEVTDRLHSQGMATVVVTATPGSALLPLGSLAPLLPTGSTSTGLPVLPVLACVSGDRAIPCGRATAADPRRRSPD